MNKFWFLAFLIAFASCTPEENNFEEIIDCAPISGALAIIVNETGTERNDYCYKEDGTINFIATYNENYRFGQQSTNEYFFDSLGQVIRIESFIPGIIYMSSLNAFDHEVKREYSYIDGKVAEIKETADYRLTDGALFIQYLTYDYNEQGQMIKETYESESNVNGQPITEVTGYSEFTYNNIGELESEIFYSNQDSAYTLSSIKKYTFDSFENPLRFRPERVFENNIQSIEVTNYFDEDSSTYSIDYIYYYNDDGFPTSKETYYNMEYSNKEYYAYFNDENDE